LIAFVVYQTFKLNDILIDTLLISVQAAVNTAEKAHKEAYYQERGQRTQSFAALADRLEQSVRETLSAIGRIVADPQLGDSEKVALINATLVTQDGQPNAAERQIDEFKRNWAAVDQGRDAYALLEEQSLKLQHRVADIVRQVRFAPNCGKPALWNALLHYQNRDGAIDKSAPVAFLSARATRRTGQPGWKVPRLAVQGAALCRGRRCYQVRRTESGSFGEIPLAGRLPDPGSGLGSASRRVPATLAIGGIR
jgi:hypothetical protein